MPSLDLNLISPAQLQQELSRHQTIVACLCAEWCDVCTAYRPKFDDLANQHPDCLFLWIDIEDQADVVGDFDIDNFPTLTIQQNDTVLFFGTMQPDCTQLSRMILRLVAPSTEAGQGTLPEQARDNNSTCCSSDNKELHTDVRLRPRFFKAQP